MFSTIQNRPITDLLAAARRSGQATRRCRLAGVDQQAALYLHAQADICDKRLLSWYHLAFACIASLSDAKLSSSSSVPI
jgi:hypothetical protein